MYKFLTILILGIVSPFFIMGQQNRIYQHSGSTNPVAPTTNVLFSDTIRCPNVSGYYYRPITLSDTMKFIADQLSSEVGCSGTLTLTTDGTQKPIMFYGFNSSNIASGSVLASGSYTVKYEMGTSGLDIEVVNPSLQVIGNNALALDPTMLEDSCVFALSGRYNDYITTGNADTVTAIDNFGGAPFYSWNNIQNVTFDDLNNALLFNGVSAIRNDTVADYVQNFNDSYTKVFVFSVSTDSIIHSFDCIVMNTTSSSRIRTNLKGNTSLSNSVVERHRANSAVDLSIWAKNAADEGVKHIVALSYDGNTNAVTAYVDGTLVKDGVSLSADGTGTSLYYSIGLKTNSTGTGYLYGEPFYGSIYE